MTSKLPLKLYVGCALTDAPDNFKLNVEQFKDALRSEGYEVFDFIGLVDGTAADVYNWDIGHCVGDCDAFIGICDLPSLGLGFEIARALQCNKPTLLVAHETAKVTRLILGAAEAEPSIRFERYTNLATDVIPFVEELTAKLRK